MPSRSRLSVGLFILRLLTLSPFSPVNAQLDDLSPWADTETGFAPDVGLADGWNASYPEFEGTAALPDNNDGATGSDGDGDGGDDIDPDPGLGLNSTLAGRAAKDFYLRVMPLGASITQGVHSSDNNGYRKWLRQQLRFKGWNVNMVGTMQTGTMKDRDHEGHPGWIINETPEHHGVHQAWANAKGLKPNLVLLNVGTNDCSYGLEAGAGDRIEALVRDIFNDVPGVVVILSTLIPSPSIKACAARVSEQYRAAAARLENGRIAVADFNTAMTDAMFSSDDGIHPTDAGYKFMASVWWDAIAKVENAITAPIDTGVDDSKATSSCAKVAGVSRGPIITQRGYGHDDGIYVHKSRGRGVLPSLRFTKPKSEVEADEIPRLIWFAQVTNIDQVDRSKALDDWIRIYRHTSGDKKNEYWFRENRGNGTFDPSYRMDIAQNCDNAEAFAWADWNNDGLADLFCIFNKTITVSINKNTRPPTFYSIGTVVPDIAPFKPSDVRIADIDGDGRADLCFVHDNGDIGCSRNGGVGTSHYWQGFSTPSGLRGIVFTGKNKGNKNRVRLADLNGDFRADWMWIGDEGDVDTYINQRGTGKGIVPHWSASGITHAGLHTAGTGDRILFGRIFGSGRLDYVHLVESDDHYDMEVWENLGAGGTKRKSDGVFYCDMTGSGSDDYVWIYKDGHADAGDFFANIHSPPDWGHSITISLSVPGPREGIHLADWDGDGRCDVLVQDRATGSLRMWHNEYDAAAKKLTFKSFGVVMGGLCSEGWGVGIFDRGLRLADIDGDGRTDYLCLQPNGRVTAWLWRDNGFIDVGQVKATEGFDRANIRFADVEGSGRADLIHLDKYTGAARVFKNDGYRPQDKDKNRGSTFHWTNRGVLYSPIDRGENMHFVNFGGLGRADLHHTWPDKNNAETFFNECGGTGGDDGAVADPGLPPYSSPGGPGGDDDNTGGNDVYIDPIIWSQPNPTIACSPPCTLILPPVTLSSATTFTCPPLHYTVSLGPDTSITTTVTPAPVTTTAIEVWNIAITTVLSQAVIYTPTPSILCPPVTITDGPPRSRRTQTLTPFVFPDPRQPTTPIPTLYPFPLLTWTNGPPSPTCTRAAGCGGHKCRFFCGTCDGSGCVPGGGGGPPGPGCPLCLPPPGGGGCLGLGCADEVGDQGGNEGKPDEPCRETRTLGQSCDVDCLMTWEFPAHTWSTASCETGCLTTQACGATDTTSTISETVPVPVATPVEVEGDDFVGTDVDAGDQDVLLDWDNDLNYDDYVDGMGDDDGGGGDGGDGGEDPGPGAPPGANGHAPAWYLGQQQYTPPSSQIDPFPETSVWYLGWSRADGEADLDVCDDDNWHMLSVVYPGKVEDSWLKGITDVFGATCDYTNDDESKEYDEDYENGDVVGHLDCGDTWGRATCVKDRSSGLKDCKIIGAPVYTERLLKCTWD